MEILIVKLSSLGDIIKTYQALYQIRQAYPGSRIFWAVETRFKEAVEPLKGLDGIYLFDFRGLKKWKIAPFLIQAKKLRQKKFDLVFDFQGNFKSAIVTKLARSKNKVGFDRKSVAEWPNLLATNRKVYAPHHLAPEERASLLIDHVTDGVRFGNSIIKLQIESKEKKETQVFLNSLSKNILVVCPFSAWDQKTLDTKDWIEWIRSVRTDWAYDVVICYYSEKEQKIAKEIQSFFSHVHLWKISSISAWQYLMSHSKAIVAVDSASLHLAAVMNIPTFSLFGPTSKNVYGPVGENHLSIQGTCHFGKVFNQKCKLLRTCTAPCIKKMDTEYLRGQFEIFMKKNLQKRFD